MTGPRRARGTALLWLSATVLQSCSDVNAARRKFNFGQVPPADTLDGLLPRLQLELAHAPAEGRAGLHRRLAGAYLSQAQRKRDVVLRTLALEHAQQSLSGPAPDLLALYEGARIEELGGNWTTALRLWAVVFRLVPDNLQVSLDYAMSLGRLGSYTKAIRILEQLRQRSSSGAVVAELVHLKAVSADWRNYEMDMAAIRYLTQAQLSAGDRPYLQPFDALAYPLSSAELGAIARAWADFAASPARGSAAVPLTHAPLIFPAAWAKGGEARLRVGYVNAEWSDQSAVGRVFQIVALHDRARFHVSCYALRHPTDADVALLARLGARVDALVDLAAYTDEAAAVRVNGDRVHVLVDLNGYTGGARPAIFAYRPAKAQVAMQGFAGTLGNVHVHHTVVDHVMVTAEMAPAYSEALVYLAPSAFIGQVGTSSVPADHEQLLSLCSSLRIPGACRNRLERRAKAAVQVAAKPEPAVEDEAPLPFVMCNFNRAFKLEPLIMRTWLDVLARAPTALLWLFSWDNATEVRPTLCSVLVPQVQRILSRSSARPAQVQRNILRFAEAERGRAVAQRIHFTPMLPAEHQGVLKGTANLFVDTPQYNAHGTLTEVLSVGMPVVTLPLDKSHASRVAASILVGMQRTELIARTLDDYACICADLAASVRRRATVERSFAQSSALAVAAEAAWIGQIERAWRHLSDLSELPGAPRHLVLRSAT